MKLYYSPGASSLSPHIVACEAELPLELIKVDLESKLTETGEDFRQLNPTGYVPLLILDDGNRLTEGPVIVQYLADQAPDKKLIPPGGTFQRYQLQQWLNFISTEIHKSFSPLFNPGRVARGNFPLRRSQNRT
jgi:glutathione S-transferase